MEDGNKGDGGRKDGQGMEDRVTEVVGNGIRKQNKC